MDGPMGFLTGNIPGGVLKILTKEHSYLDQFVTLLQQRQVAPTRTVVINGQLTI
jgi:hypothetical protein